MTISEYEIKAKALADIAFKSAIEDGILSDDESADNYAGNYMYMGVTRDDAHKDAFKHIVTRRYIYS